MARNRWIADFRSKSVLYICRLNKTGDDGMIKNLSLNRSIPLTDEHRIAVPTKDAAHHLSRAEQTLRIWACHDTGPLRPIRINGRLMWPVADIKRLLGLGEKG